MSWPRSASGLRSVCVALFVVLLPMGAFAVEPGGRAQSTVVSGEWVLTVEGVQLLELSLWQDDDRKVSGTATGAAGSMPIKDGDLSGNRLRFFIITEVSDQAGKTTFNATVTDNGEMTGTMSSDADGSSVPFSAVRRTAQPTHRGNDGKVEKTLTFFLAPGFPSIDDVDAMAVPAADDTGANADDDENDMEQVVIHLGLIAGEFVWDNGLGFAFDFGFMGQTGRFSKGAVVFSPSFIAVARQEKPLHFYGRAGLTLMGRSDLDFMGRPHDFELLWHGGGGANLRLDDRLGLKAEARFSQFFEDPEAWLFELILGLNMTLGG